jgi:hypothetical protein
MSRSAFLHTYLQGTEAKKDMKPTGPRKLDNRDPATIEEEDKGDRATRRGISATR